MFSFSKTSSHLIKLKIRTAYMDCTSLLGCRINICMPILCRTPFPFQAYKEMDVSGPFHPHEASYFACEMGHISQNCCFISVIQRIIIETADI